MKDFLDHAQAQGDKVDFAITKLCSQHLHPPALVAIHNNLQYGGSKILPMHIFGKHHSLGIRI